MSVETTTASVLDQSSDQWGYYSQAQLDFGGDEVVVVAFEMGPAVTAGFAAELDSFTRNVEATEGVRRVDSLVSVPAIRHRDGIAVLEPPLSDWHALVGSGPDQLCEFAAGSLMRGLLLSPDCHFMAINVVLAQGAERHYDAILSATARIDDQYQPMVTGVPTFRSSADRYTRSELIRLLPVVLVCIGLLAWVVLRSVTGALAALLPGALATLVVFGVMGLAGTPVTITTVILPTVFLALGCAYSMHFLTQRRSAGEETDARMLAVATPVALSGLTTSLGFVGVSLVDIEAVRGIGGYGALGVLIAVSAALTLVPPIARAPLPRQGREASIERCAAWVLGAVRARPGRTALVWAMLVMLAGAGGRDLRVDTDVIEWFSPQDVVRTDYEAIRRNLSGISPVNFVIDFGEGSLLGTEGALAALADFEAELEKDPRVGRVLSIAAPLVEMQAAFAEPGHLDPEAAAQYLLVLESHPFVADLLNSSGSRANVLARVNDNHSKALLEVAVLGEEWWARRGAAGSTATATGIMFEFARAQEQIAVGQIRGLAFAILAVSAVLLLRLRSVRLACIALVPNVVPVLLIFGGMGALGIPIDAGTVIVGNLAIGIAVDDTIHIVTRFDTAHRSGMDVLLALESAIADTAPALVFSTGVVAAGFGLLATSQFQFIEHLGVLMASAMVLCLTADMSLLPAAIWVGFRPR